MCSEGPHLKERKQKCFATSQWPETFIKKRTDPKQSNLEPHALAGRQFILLCLTSWKFPGP
eukprot:1137338-Pelagomonas_calceolata.AAC.2